MKYISTLLLLLFSISTMAVESPIAEVVKIDGKVSILGKKALTKQAAILGIKLYAGDIITTGPRGRTKIKMFDGSVIIIDPKSHITLNNEHEIKQGEGKTYFKVRKRKKANKIKIVTDFVVIGVKGTSFIVSTTDNDKRITMNDGVVSVESLDKAFELYRVNEEAEFKQFQKAMSDEFDTYQRELKKEFAEYVKSFDLSEGHSISFDGSRTIESRNSKDIIAEINYFESF